MIILKLVENFLNSSYLYVTQTKIFVKSRFNIIEKSFKQTRLDFEDCCKLEELRYSVKLRFNNNFVFVKIENFIESVSLPVKSSCPSIEI